jgi:hypothetical protein
MAQARPIDRTTSQPFIYLVAALIAALVLGATMAIGNFGFFGPSTPNTTGAASPAVLRSEASWLSQRLAQSGYIEPAVRSARAWEYERLQQSGHAGR